MKRIEKYIPVAIDVVEDVILDKYTRVADEWDNCVANFGAAIRQMGLLAAVTAFSQESDRTTVPKKELMHCIARIILTADGKVCEADKDLLSLVKEKPHNTLLRQKITDAAIAMKLALRLFIEKPKEREETEDASE